MPGPEARAIIGKPCKKGIRRRVCAGGQRAIAKVHRVNKISGDRHVPIGPHGHRVAHRWARTTHTKTFGPQIVARGPKFHQKSCRTACPQRTTPKIGAAKTVARDPYIAAPIYRHPVSCANTKLLGPDMPSIAPG